MIKQIITVEVTMAYELDELESGEWQVVDPDGCILKTFNTKQRALDNINDWVYGDTGTENFRMAQLDEPTDERLPTARAIIDLMNRTIEQWNKRLDAHPDSLRAVHYLLDRITAHKMSIRTITND